MKKAAIVGVSLFLLWCQNLPAIQNIFQPEISLGMGLGSGFVRIGKMYKAHELALRYFFTSSVFSEHMDDHKEIGALYYLNLPPEGSPIFLRLGIGAALCLVETYPKSDPVIGLPIDLQLILRPGHHFSLGLYDSMTVNSLKNYQGFGITISVFF